MEVKRRKLSPKEGEGSNKPSIIEDFPEDVLLNIFEYLSQNDIASIARVCRKWRRVARTDSLWKSVDVKFWYHHKYQNKVALRLANMLPNSATRIKMDFRISGHWTDRLSFKKLSKKLNKKCPDIELFVLYNARLLNSLSSVINLCAHFLKNIKILVMYSCEFFDKHMGQNYNDVSPIEILHLEFCTKFDTPPFSQMPHLKKLRCSSLYGAADVNSWFEKDASFMCSLNMLNILDSRFNSGTFQNVWKLGNNLTELYVCYSTLNDTDLDFKEKVFPHLKIICVIESLVTVTGINSLMTSCKSLEKVYVSNRCFQNAEHFRMRSYFNNECNADLIVIVECNHNVEKEDFFSYKSVTHINV